jgi:CheY-like chemotaxis protein
MTTWSFRRECWLWTTIRCPTALSLPHYCAPTSRPKGTEDPASALQMLKEKHCDLVLLDIEMPGMDGFELCKRMRALPGYQRTPVIYVTAHSDFEYRAKSVLSGGNDLIAKPVFPIELAVKAVTHLLKSRLAEPSPAR